MSQRTSSWWYMLMFWPRRYTTRSVMTAWLSWERAFSRQLFSSSRRLVFLFMVFLLVKAGQTVHRRPELPVADLKFRQLLEALVGEGVVLPLGPLVRG